MQVMKNIFEIAKKYSNVMKNVEISLKLFEKSKELSKLI